MSTLEPRPAPDSRAAATRGVTEVKAKPGPAGEGLEAHLSSVGTRLRSSLEAVLAELPDGAAGPQRLARALSLDKVVLSRLLKALRAHDPLATLHHAPGPEPLRRVLKAARRTGATKEILAAANAAVDAFEEVIKGQVGDRSALDAILSAWVPDARAAFELRRKQAAHRALSELKGLRVETQLSTVLLHPNADGETLDVVWVMGLFGLTRLRPGVVAKLASRRMAGERSERTPRTLAGDAIDPSTDAFLTDLRLDDYCQNTPAELSVARHGDVVHYVLGDVGFGPRSAVDLVLAEVNLAEMPRFVPTGSGRKGYVFLEVAPPSRRIVFDAFVHEDVYPGADPQLSVYETALEGVASVNDRGRDLDRLQLQDTVQPLGSGLERVRSTHVPRLDALTRHVFEQMGWDAARFRGYRVESDYPLYGSQVCLAFDAPERD